MFHGYQVVDQDCFSGNPGDSVQGCSAVFVVSTIPVGVRSSDQESSDNPLVSLSEGRSHGFCKGGCIHRKIGTHPGRRRSGPHHLDSAVYECINVLTGFCPLLDPEI